MRDDVSDRYMPSRSAHDSELGYQIALRAELRRLKDLEQGWPDKATEETLGLETRLRSAINEHAARKPPKFSLNAWFRGR